MSLSAMTSLEKRAVITISAIISLRMIGLFMVIPVFALFAEQMPGATPFLMGLAIGVYGLSQAVLQIPFGALSDFIGRKPVIIFGLSLFIFGSLLAAFSNSIYALIFSRALQGAGAIGGTLLACLADLTREHQRTKSMAIAGITIGFAFSIAMLIGPILNAYITVRGIFLLAVLLGSVGVLITIKSVPTVKDLHWHRDTQPELKSFVQLIFHPHLLKLNVGIFSLHAIFTATFIALPFSLLQFSNIPAAQQWTLYLPALIPAFIISFAVMGYAERKQRIKIFFMISIAVLGISELCLLTLPYHLVPSVLILSLFFTGFSILEAFLPSLVSRIAPAAKKGSAMGIYSCAQFLGIFAGGLFGGLLYAKFNSMGVYFFCITLLLSWLLITTQLQLPARQLNEILPIGTMSWACVASKLKTIPGIVEMVFIPAEKAAYLKMDTLAAKHPDFLALKNELQQQQ